MSSNRRILMSAGVLAGILLFAGAASAAEEGAASSANAASEAFKWINFAILAGGIVWLVRTHGRPFFRHNAERIGSAISKAAAVKAHADQQLNEVESRLGRLDQEVAAFRAEAQREASAEAERIHALARSDAEKVALAARAEIEAAERAARQELRVFAAKLAVEGAESLLARQLTPKTHDALITDFVKSLPGRPN